MIPVIIALVFVVFPIAALVYIFRGLGEDSNPLWGNVLAAGLGAVVSGVVASWFITGAIASTYVVTNATYAIDTASAAATFANSSITVTQLGEGNSGMFVRSSISGAGADVLGNSTITVTTSDIIYLQYQDIGLMFFYMLLCIILIALFAWSVSELRKELRARDSYDPYMDGGDQ